MSAVQLESCVSEQPSHNASDGDPTPARSFSFYVRLWREPTRMSDRPVWRGSLQAADDSGPSYFSNAAELQALLARFLQEDHGARGAAPPES